MSEAQVLGLETVVQMGRIREKEQRRKGREVDAAEKPQVGVAKEPAGGPEAMDTLASLLRANPVTETTTTPSPENTEETQSGVTKEDGEYSG